MRGATEYANLFKTEQFGRLFIVVGKHARGKTFRIYVLPEGEEAKRNGDMNPPLNKDAVEVYGVVGGQRGWTESYGWILKGKWQEDFESLVEVRKELAKDSQEKQKETLAKKEEDEKAKTRALLESY